MGSYDWGIDAVGAKALEKVAQQITHVAHLVDNVAPLVKQLAHLLEVKEVSKRREISACY